ncbi:MAG: putative transposase [Egibacteraceae bacterium]
MVSRVCDGPPLPLPHEGSTPVKPGVDLLESADGGAVFVWGNAAWCWADGDVAGRRLAAVQMVATKAASQRQVADAFGVSDGTLRRWQRAYEQGGTAALAPEQKGPRRASRLTEDKVAEIAAARGQGLSMRAVADRTGVSLNSVSRALATQRPPSDQPVTLEQSGVEQSGVEMLTPLARPAPRTAERAAAREGLIVEAPPVITQGAGLPLAGALVILPALAVTGLLEIAEQTYVRGRAAFYGLRSLLLTIAFAALVGQPRAEGLCRIGPADLGRLIGLDRAPEVKTVRRRIGELAAQGCADRLLAGLAARHVDAHADAVGILYVDGHVRAYHGKADVSKKHLARMRLSMPAEEDTWICDAHGDGVLVWQAPAATSLVGELRQVAKKVRDLVGPDARPTVCFDRGGYSPKLFAQLDAAGFDILTYRKGAKTPEPDDAFRECKLTDDRGREHAYHLADRNVVLTYTDDGGQRTLECRQITRRSKNGHQTQILTTRTDKDPAVIAHLMFSRWRQESFFRYMRHRFDLDGLDAYTTIPDDPNRTVPNPAKSQAHRRLKQLQAAVGAAQACHDRHTVAGVSTPDHRQAHNGLAAEIAAARTELEALEAKTKATPARAPLSQVRPDARRGDPERKRIHDAARMAVYNAESALARLLTDHYPRAGQEARTLLTEIYTAPADLQIVGDQLHVRINPLSAPRRTRALAGLCAELTATQTVYPGTDLTLVYTVKDP